MFYDNKTNTNNQANSELVLSVIVRLKCKERDRLNLQYRATIKWKPALIAES
jgi:hypothetical protein